LKCKGGRQSWKGLKQWGYDNHILTFILNCRKFKGAEVIPHKNILDVRKYDDNFVTCVEQIFFSKHYLGAPDGSLYRPTLSFIDAFAIFYKFP
jgi:hypothetical protein